MLNIRTAQRHLNKGRSLVLKSARHWTHVRDENSWAVLGSNQRWVSPTDYEPAAITTRPTAQSEAYYMRPRGTFL